MTTTRRTWTSEVTRTLHSFEVKDARGRVIGAAIRAYEVEYVENTEESLLITTQRSTMPAGRHFVMHPWATRDGQDYGAVQGERFYKTAEERDQAVAKYLADARKRAAKKA